MARIGRSRPLSSSKSRPGTVIPATKLLHRDSDEGPRRRRPACPETLRRPRRTDAGRRSPGRRTGGEETANAGSPTRTARARRAPRLPLRATSRAPADRNTSPAGESPAPSTTTNSEPGEAANRVRCKTISGGSSLIGTITETIASVRSPSVVLVAEPGRASRSRAGQEG